MAPLTNKQWQTGVS